jgi:cell wall-associated NlpC family hydrolase
MSSDMNFCWDKEVEERMKFIEYIVERESNCYKLGSYGVDGCYDCTGMIFSYFAEGRKRTYKDGTRYFWDNYPKVSKKDAKTGDLLLMY